MRGVVDKMALTEPVGEKRPSGPQTGMSHEVS